MCTPHAVSNNFLATDLMFYSQNPELSIDQDLDLQEHTYYKARLEKMGVRTEEGFNIFNCGGKYSEVFGDVAPVLTLAVGLYYNCDSADMSTEQMALFKTMGKLNSTALDSLSQTFPASLTALISCSRIADIDKITNLKNLLTLPVVAQKDEYALTNVRYGETDLTKRHLEPNFTALLSGNLKIAIPFFRDNGLAIFDLFAQAIRTGPVLLLAGNRFQCASVLFENALKSLNGGHCLPSISTLLAIGLPFKEEPQKRFIFLVFEHGGSWNGVSTFAQLMAYTFEDLPMNFAERALAWSLGKPVA